MTTKKNDTEVILFFCPECKVAISSMFNHDFTRCRCGAMFIDAAGCRAGGDFKVWEGSFKLKLKLKPKQFKELLALKKK